MTFVKTHFKLNQPLTAREIEMLGRLSTRYGIRGLSLENGNLVVDYDGSRMHEAEVLAAVRGAGISVEPIRALEQGSYDYTGEFKDYAWPMTGLSPFNQKSK